MSAGGEAGGREETRRRGSTVPVGAARGQAGDGKSHTSQAQRRPGPETPDQENKQSDSSEDGPEQALNQCVSTRHAREKTLSFSWSGDPKLKPPRAPATHRRAPRAAGPAVHTAASASPLPATQHPPEGSHTDPVQARRRPHETAEHRKRPKRPSPEDRHTNPDVHRRNTTQKP